MSYLEREESADTRFFKKVGSVVLGLIAFALAKVMFSGGSDFITRQTFSSDKLDKELLSDPSTGKTYLEMKTRFPADYERMIAGLANLVKSGASNDEIRLASFNAMHTFTLSHLKEVSLASDGSLVAIAQAQSRIADSLSADSDMLCAQFGFSGLDASARPSTSAMTALQGEILLLMKAADEGARRPKYREVKEINDADAEALAIALTRNGLSRGEVEMLGSPSLKTASDSDKCKLTRALYKSVAEMPPPQAARLTASMLLSLLDSKS